MAISDFTPGNPSTEQDDDAFFAEALSPEPPKKGLSTYLSSQQASMVAIMNGGDLVEDYSRVYNNLSERGQDEEVDAYRAEAVNQEADVAETAAKGVILDADISDNDKLSLLNGIVESTATEPPPLRAAFVELAAEGAQTRTGTEDRTQLAVIDNVDQVIAADAEIERLKMEFASTFEADTGEALVDFTAGAVLPGYGVKLKQIIDAVMPEQGAAWENAAPGEALKRFKLAFRDASPEDKVAMAKLTIKMVEEYNTLLWSNDYDKFSYVEELLGDLNPTDSSIETDRWLNNVFGVLDVVPGVTAVMRGSKTVFKSIRRSSTLGTLAEAAPWNANAMMRGVLEDPSGQLEEAVGASKEAIVTQAGLPKAMADSELLAVPDLGLNKSAVDVAGKGLYAHTNAFTPSERVGAASAVAERLQSLEEVAPVLQLSKTQIAPIPGGVQARMTVAASDNYGWATAEEAMEGVRSFIEVQEGASVRLLKRDFKSGKYREVSPMDVGYAPDGEYVAQVDITHMYNADDVEAKSLRGTIVGVGGNAAKYLTKASVFARWITEGGNTAGDQRAAIKGELGRIMKPFYDIPTAKQSKVLSVLDEGDAYVDPKTGQHTGKWFSQNELTAMFDGDAALVDAYQSVRAHQDKVYDIQNARLRQRMERGGFKTVTSSVDDYQALARPMTKEEAGAEQLRSYDPEIGQVVDIDPADLDTLYGNGGQILRLPSEEMYGSDVVDTIVLFPGGSTKVTRLPQNILKKRDGYITRVYDTAYIVKKRVTGVSKNGRLVEPQAGETFNGVPLKAGERLVTVKMASNSGSAARAAKELQLASRGGEFGYVRARELSDAEYGNQLNYDSFRDTGQLFFSKRGTEVSSVTGERTLAGVAESLEVARNNAARHAGMDTMVDSMTARWEKAYGKDFGTNGKFPSRGRIPEPDEPAAREAWNEAVALRDHINMLGGVDTTTIARANRKMMVFLAEKVAGAGDSKIASGSRKLADVILKGKDRSVLDGLKAVAFLKYIVFNPLRQLLLQPQQMTLMLGIDGGYRYFLSGKGIRDWTGLAAGLAARDNPAVWARVAPSAAKGLGMSTKEYKEFVDLFRKSGIPDSIDSHTFVTSMALDKRSAVADNLLAQGGTQLVEGARNVTRFARKVGFDAGEYANISYTWLAVRNKWMEANPGKLWSDPDNLEDITAQARNISLNMTSTGVLQQQKGLLGVAFQFMSHTTKSMQVLLPSKAFGKTIGKLSDKSFNGKEKFRIFVSQLGLYGTGGYGAISAWNALRDNLGVETPDEVNNAVEEGLLGYLIQSGFHLAFDEEGEDTKLSFSTSFGPFSGTPTATPLQKIVPAMVDVVLMQSPDTRMLLPPSIGAIHSIGDSVEMANFIANGIDLPEDKPEKWLAVAERALTVAPIYGNYLEARVASNIGMFTSRSGNPTVAASGGEIAAKAMFGIRSKTQVEVGDTLRGLTGTKGVISEGGKDEIRQMAKQYASNAIRTLQQINMTGPLAKHKAYDAMTPHITAIKLGLNEAQFFRFQQDLLQQLFSDLGSNQETRLANELFRIFGQGEALGGDLANKIKHMQPFEGKDEVVKWLETIQARPLDFSEDKKGKIQRGD